MGVIKDIIDDYENLIKTKITIPLDDGDVIKFEFQPQDLPHLLGLQHLVDNPVLFEYSQDRLSATDLYKGMCNGDVDVDEFEKSSYFEEVFQNRIKYFSSSMILDIISARQIVKFDPKRIKVFTTKLDKLYYMFWKLIKDENNNYGYFGIGFMATGKKSDRNYPNTFFFRSDNQYICSQESVIPMSLMITDKMKQVTLDIYWEEIRASMGKNSHYKYLISNSEHICDEFGNIKQEEIFKCENEDIKKHYQLLRADELNKAYLPYMDKEFRWTNDEKCYILSKIDQANKVLYPGDIKMLLNQYRQNQIKECETGNMRVENRKQNSMHYYIEATLNKSKNELDYSDIIGKKVSGTIDRPMGTTHPKHSNILYGVNYGYVDGIIAGDGAEQDIYLLGVDEPVSRYEGVVIAVIHRNNDIEDKWVVAPQGMTFSNEEILEKTMFQEKYFDIELYR